MVDGLERVMTPCAVVDLDGTIIRGNSMHEMVRFMLSEGMGCGNLCVVAKLLGYLAKRRMRLTDHRGMKYPIHRIAEAFLHKGDRMERLVERVVLKVNQEVRYKLDVLRREGNRIIIATAAPDVYMPALAEALGADAYTATPLSATPDGYLENRGERKLSRAVEMARSRGWDICCVLTDHSDDLPLLRLQGVERVLVAPADKLCETLTGLNLPFTVVG
jgi:phosphoserine phosphatase